MVAATGERSRDWHVRALISCAALLAAAVLAPGSLASGLIPDPDPNPDPAQPQPDAYQSAPATAPAAASTETPAPVLPTVHISTPPTQLHSAPRKVQLHPVMTPAHVSEAAAEAPAPRSTPSRTEPHIVVPAEVATVPPKAKHAQRTDVARGRRQLAHHARATAPRAPIIRFAGSALGLRWPAAFAPSVEIARPRQVSPGVALAVAAVVLLSGSFLAVAARQLRQEVGP